MDIREFINILFDEKDFVREFTYDTNYKALAVKDDDIYTDIYSADEDKGIRKGFGRKFNINGNFNADKINKKAGNIYGKDYINSGIGRYAASISINRFSINSIGGAGEFTGKMPETDGINKNFLGNKGFLNRGFPNGNRGFFNSRGNFPRGSNNFFRGSNSFPRGGNSFLRRGGGFPRGGPGGLKRSPGGLKGLNSYGGGFGFPNGPGNLNNPSGLYNYYPYFFIPLTIPNNNKPLLKDPPSFNSKEFNTFKYYNYF